MDKPEIFMAPGPTPVPPEVLAAQAAPLVYHRGPGYGALLREVAERAGKLAGTSPVLRVHDQPGSGQPLVESERTILKDCPDFDGELFPARFTIPNPARRFQGFALALCFRLSLLA